MNGDSVVWVPPRGAGGRHRLGILGDSFKGSI